MTETSKISQQENSVSEFWKKNKIFEKSIEKDAPNGDFIFYDGPPFITGLPHYGTLLTSIPKDVVPRFQTMNGKRVSRVWGWDCHGLPAENKVEKELGLKTKQDIENIGIGKFVDSCKTYVKNVSDQWDWYIDKIARWVDMKNAYKTMDLSFMESVIWGFKQLYDKGLIYEGHRCSLHCPRCATPLSKFEITMDAGSYKDVTESSVIVEFQIKGEEKTSILVWTTTPWTLPGNLALAVGKDIDYVKVSFENKNYILAKDRLEEIFKDYEYEIIEEFKGETLIGKEYKPVFELDKSAELNDKAYKIYEGDFVTTEDGTGVVHIAPNFGEDDFLLGKKEGLPILELMDEIGVYTKLGGKDFEGLYFKDANKVAIRKLEENKMLFSKFNYTHSYPFCYRCETPLIYKVQKAWYMDIDKIRDSMIKTNENINWVPDYFKGGRFKHNLETAPHWCLSRSRYWGSPIPVWRCEKCNELKVVGSIKEIEELSGKKVEDLHRPKIDEHEFGCSCGGKMKRVVEVFDCWFESGAMSYAQFHYPFEKKDEFKKIFPADFIIEYTGQLRGWFYTLHAVSNSLFSSEAFRNVVCHGVLAGTDGRKMSKSYGNYPDPKETLETYGGDAIRMYFLTSPLFIGGDMNLSEKDIRDSLRKNVMLLLNVLKFYEEAKGNFQEVKSNNLLDKWILSRINELVNEVTENMNKYNLPGATRPISLFIDDLSTWYLRQTRERLNEKDTEALSTLHEVLLTLSKVIAPFMPFVSEYVFQKITGDNFLNGERSVHLERWPEAQNVDKKVIEDMQKVREIVSYGLKQRDQNKVGLKWPLAKVEIYAEKISGYDDIIKEQLNVKEVEFRLGRGSELVVEMDFNLTPELEVEGYAREITRQVQAFRKKLGLQKKDKIELLLFTDDEFKEILETQQQFIEERTNAKMLNFESVTTDKEKFKNKINFRVKDKNGEIVIIIDEK